MWLSVLLLLADVSADPSPAAAQDDPTFNVLSFNVRYATAKDGENHWDKRRELVFQVLRDHRPDVVGIQEGLRFQLNEIHAAVPGYAEVGCGRDDGNEKGEYAAILYRADRFQLIRSDTFWFSSTPATAGSTTWGNTLPRICTWAWLVDRPSGKAVRVFNVHLDHASQPSRERSAAALLDAIAEQEDQAMPAIVMGDFNAGEDNPAIQIMKGGRSQPATRPLVDSFRVAHPGATDVGTFNGFAGTTTGDKIDYIFVSPEIVVVEAAIIRDQREGRYPSDHFPIYATLRLPVNR